ncbi:MAG: DUF2007 domain-containing protein [Anaerolineae bacterium]|nr:DUF2007 domain-containing protein [Anaerolineae bacterium]HOV49229.1 hypothetical protein [Anaerolineae bacterium]HRT32737.1 hypothetical protein [Anaerolineae bacterium]HXK42687.1 hypothetical protein [Anaerolineae bacterium]
MSILTEEQVGLVTVHVAEGLLQAMVIRGALESAGIPVVLSYEKLSTSPETAEHTGQVRVMVPIEWQEEAEKLLHARPRPGEVFSVPPGTLPPSND